MGEKNKHRKKIFLNPLVQWVWIRGLVIVFGMLILLTEVAARKAL